MLELKNTNTSKNVAFFQIQAVVLSQFKCFEFSLRKKPFQKQMSFIRTFDVVPELKPCTQGKKRDRVGFQIIPVSSVFSFDNEVYWKGCVNSLHKRRWARCYDFWIFQTKTVHTRKNVLVSGLIDFDFLLCSRLSFTGCVSLMHHKLVEWRNVGKLIQRDVI